jgi:hypothetical protein
VGTGAIGQSKQGCSVAIAENAGTAAVGGCGDNNNLGAVWVFTETGSGSSGVWNQQAELVATSAVGTTNIDQGKSVALSADGNTLLVGGYGDNSGVGAAWVFTQSGGVWTQQAKLVGTGTVGAANQGYSVALSNDGNTAVLGAPMDNNGAGAAWIFTRNAGAWTQLGSKLVGSGAQGNANQGTAVAISPDGNEIMIGGPGDNSDIGAVWAFATTQPAPVIQDLSPGVVTAGGPGFTLTVSGMTFVSGAVVYWNGLPLSTTFVNSGQLTAVVPAGDYATAGTGIADITVVNPGGGSQTSLPALFTVNSPPCTITFSPSSLSLPANGTSSIEACPGPLSNLQCGVDTGASTATIQVNASGSCTGWSVTSNSPLAVQISPSTSTGSGTTGAITFTVFTNTHTYEQGFTIDVNTNNGVFPFTLTEAASPLTGTLGQTYREVYALYQQLLNRDPDPSGLAFWTGIGDGGLGEMADSFLTSPELFNTQFAIMAAYQAVTGNAPSYEQFVPAVTSGQGAVALFNSLVAANPGFTPADMYQNLLNRQPSSADSACIASGLVQCFETIIGYPAANTPVGAVNNEFQSTGTYHTGLTADHTNSLYVKLLYYLILRRDPDGGGLAFWINVANSGGPGLLFQGAAGYATRIEIVGTGTPNEGFVGSPEFQGLFVN